MACTRSGNWDPVGELLAELEAAAEARDAKVFEKRIASGFSGNEGISRDEALTLLRRYFVAYETIDLNVTNVERSESGNRVKFHVSFAGRAKAELNLQNLLPATATYNFELRLVQEENMLKVNKAYWQESSNF
jgi:hypothetical protein